MASISLAFVAALLAAPLLASLVGGGGGGGMGGAVLTSAACAAATLVGGALCLALLPRAAVAARRGARGGWHGQIGASCGAVLAVMAACSALGVPAPSVPPLAVAAATWSFLFRLRALAG